MQLHPYALAIVNDLFDDDLDADFLGEPTRDAETASAIPAEAAGEADAPERRLQ